MLSYAVIGIFGLGVGWAFWTYNSLIRHVNLVSEGWSGIDAQLKRRANLIPNLVEAVKGYTAHEKETLATVTKLRVERDQDGSVAARAIREGQLGAAMGKLIAIAEDYPDLKASENFLDLQNALAEVEDQIQMARRYYNGTVRNLNTMIEQVPSNIIAGAFNFQKAEFFEIEDAADRAVPNVSLS